MSLRDQFLEQLPPTYAWTPTGGPVFLITKYRDEKLTHPVRLHLDERQFERHALWIARTSEDGDIDAALGLIFIHLDEEFAVDRPGSTITDIGVRRGKLGQRPRWFCTREPQSDGPGEPTLVWVADPPPR